MRSAIIILSGWRFLSAFFAKKFPLGVFSRADPELSSYPFWLKLKTLSHPMWGYLSEYFRYLLSFSAKTPFSKQPFLNGLLIQSARFVMRSVGLVQVFCKSGTCSGIWCGCRWSGGGVCSQYRVAAAYLDPQRVATRSLPIQHTSNCLGTCPARYPDVA